MNCYHYLLIAISVILVLEVFYDNLSEKIECLPKRKKFKFLPEKGGGRFFLYIIYLFPLIITVISPVKEKFNIFDSIKEYMSFYATALTITFAVFTFSFKLDKELELKEKEQEDKKDYYRPLFLIENMEENPNLKQVKLLMKNDSLYLEDVQVYNNDNILVPTKKDSFQSNDIVKKDIKVPLYITGKTMAGEIILFAYLYGGRKCYKYLKFDKDPSFPNVQKDMKMDNINEVWGTYNSRVEENYNILDIHLFQNTRTLRRKIKENNFIMFKDSFFAKTINDFMKNIFNDLINYCKYREPNKSYNSIYDFLMKILKEIKENMDPKYKIKNTSNLYKRLEDLSKSYIPSCDILTKESIDANEFIIIILNIMESQMSKKTKYFCRDIINILNDAFKEVSVKNQLLEYSILRNLKNYIYILEK